MRDRDLRIASFAVLATVASSGCDRDTAPGPTRASVTVTSMAPGAAVLVDGAQVAVTPVRLNVSSTRDHVITVRGAGGEHTCRLEAHASAGWVIHSIVASPAWIVELLAGYRRALELTECTMPT